MHTDILHKLGQEITTITTSPDQKRLEELVAKLKEDKGYDYTPFPIGVFPKPLQELIERIADEYQFNKEFLCGSLLAAAAGAIGRKVRVRSMIGLQSPNIYLIIVAPPGTGKSHPLRFCLQPMIDRDKKKQQDLEDDLEHADEGMPVRRKKMIYNNYTIETLYVAVKGRPEGVMVYVDEINAWIESFKSYNSSGEEAFWLSNFSGGYFTVDRKTSSLSLDNPAISVAGTIQNDVLDTFVKGDRSKNGFFERILFVMPPKVKAPVFRELLDFQYRAKLEAQYDDFIMRLYDLKPEKNDNRDFKPLLYTYDAAAHRSIIAICNSYQQLSEKTNSNAVKNLYSKMQTNIVKLSLLLQLIHDSYTDTPTHTVGTNAVMGAGLLVEYFIKTTMHARNITLFATAADKLEEPFRTIYNELGDIEGEFTTTQAIELGIKYGVSRSTMERFLRNRDVVKKARHGTYQKV